MNTHDFLQLSKRNIFHAFLKCNQRQESRYIPKYAPLVIVEFNDDILKIEDFCNHQDLMNLQYDTIKSVDLFVCARYISLKVVPEKMYDIEYVIKTNDLELHFESKSIELWKDILEVLNEHQVTINDPLELENYINHPQEDFYTFCQTNMKIWKEKYTILDPKMDDLIKK